jgi:ribulose-bisphosphate carboxylase large chain
MKKVNNTNKKAPSCDWKSSLKNTAEKNKDRIFRHKGNFKWSGVKRERYKQTDSGQGGKNWSEISRDMLIGNHGETTKFHLRYFEIKPNGYSSLEKHKHEHVVICIKGKGNIRMGKKLYILNYLDTAYVAPNTVHQLTNPYNKPFGFFCIVNSKRDKPKAVINNM